MEQKETPTITAGELIGNINGICLRKDSYLFGYYANKWKNSPSEQVSFGWVYNQITTCKELADTSKDKLPAVTFSTTTPRLAKGVEVWNKVLAYDIDHIEADEVVRVKELLRNEAALIYVTPSGKGLRVVFVCETENFTATWHAGKNYLLSLGIVVDEKCKNIDRLSFLSYDPEAVCNIGEGDL